METNYPQTSNQLAITPDTPLLSRIENKVQKAISDTSKWEDNQEKYHKMRMRIKKPKTFPFVGSSNLRMPTAEKNIRKTKAGILATIFSLRPIVQAIPTPGVPLDTAVKTEKFLDHLLMDVMGIYEKSVIAVDQALEKGFFIVKPFWRLDICDREEFIDLREYSMVEVAAIREAEPNVIIPFIIDKFDIDMGDHVADDNIEILTGVIEELKQGKLTITFKVKDITYNFPDLDLVAPERFYVPASSGVDPQKTECCTQEYFVTATQALKNVETLNWDKEVVDRLIGNASANLDDKAIDQDKNFREGVDTFGKSGLIKIREYYGYEDLDGDGKMEEVVVTYAADFRQELKKGRMDTFTKKRPFVKLFYELTDDRWFSHRGQVEIIEDIIREIDVQHNMKIDQQTIRNAPMFVYRSGLVNPNMVQTMPNQGIPVKGNQSLGDTIQALNFNNPNVEYSYEREQQILQGEVQELIGQTDFTLQSRINRREPRTLGEVELQAQANASVSGMDTSLFTMQFSKLFEMVLELWSEFGPDEYEFVYFGGTNQGETIKLTKEELQNKVTIKVRGNDQNANPNIRIQKAQQVLSGVTNPLLIQSGLVGPQQMAEGMKRFYEALDIENPEMLLNPQGQPIQDTSEVDKKRLDTVKKVFSDMTNAEKVQVLQELGIEPDLAGRSVKAQVEAVGEEAEALSKVVEAFQ